MKNSLVALLAFVFVLNLSSKADEGMWIPSLIGKLNIRKMNSIGCKLTAEQIYSINQSSLKDAVVALDHGSCTAEIISADGLLLTNHHCGYGEIQAHSTTTIEGHNYLRDGFWATKHEDELSNPGKTVTFLIRMEDVTDQVLKEVTDNMDDKARLTKVREAGAKIEKEAKGETAYETRVRSFFESNKYYLFVTQTFKDIRLVGAPPESIGKFGGETDNWMWPRHTCDFSMFRVYCAPDGKPAEYSKDNVPYHPKHFLPISLKGVEKGSFAMVMGYPGTTTRYRTSNEVKYIMDVTNVVRITTREAKLNIIQDYMATSEKANLQYSSKFARSSNYYKYSIGQNKGLAALNVIGKKEAIEKDFLKWVNETPDRKAQYGSALDSINAAFISRDEKIASQYAREALLGGPEIFLFVSGSLSLYEALKGGDKAKIEAAVKEFRVSLSDYFKDYDANTDMKIAGTLLKIYAGKVNPKYIPGFFKGIERKYKGDFNAYTQKLFERTIFSDSTKMESFLNKKTKKTLDKDMA
ncbi:MAG: S46 family peptidase, partial [Bacteroidia bacterium]|nr:S46 family peptidase [Bacteroidia bacterium]